MAQYYNVVPWFNTKEWLSVYSKICADPSTAVDKQDALNLLNIWKVRCPSLPSGIESTLSLLEVYLGDLQSSDKENNQEVVIRLAYSSAIMRFVNHMLDSETAKGMSLYYAAKKLEVPDWVIDLRHDAAHSNNLPSLELLREAADISFQWLCKNYWEKHKELIQDYVVSDLSPEDDKDGKIEDLINLCLSLSICAHSQCKIKNLSDITDAAMQESVMNDVNEFFGDTANLTNLKTMSVDALINTVNAQSKNVLGGKNRTTTINRVLLGEDTLLLSLELVDELSQTEFHLNNSLSKNYLQCFEVLLTFLHSHNLILDFFFELVSHTQNNENKSKLAALWASEILKALKRSQAFHEINTLKMSNPFKNKRKHFKQIFPHYNMATCSLLLDLSQNVPQELTNINCIQPIISTYNPYLTYFIKDLLNLVHPKLPRDTEDHICSLADLISSPSKFPAISTKLYTVKDLKLQEGNEFQDESSDSDCVQVIDSTDIDRESPVETSNDGVWVLASSNHDWSHSPIGMLPWHNSASMDVDP